MGLRSTKPFVPLSPDNIAALSAHMGVYELATEDGAVLFIGYAGGKSLFGLRSEIEARHKDTSAMCFRYEVTTAYLTRYQELLMLHQFDFDCLPSENRVQDGQGLGRLSPG